MKKVLRWVFYIFIGLMVIGYFADKKEGGNTSSNSTQASHSESAANATAAEAVPSRKSLYQTTARKLFNEYDENEVAVDEKIKDKLVAVTGIVQSIDKDFTDSIIISLKTDNEFMPARMDMKDSEKATAMGLKKGKQVMIICERMSRIVGAPSGRKCVFN